MFKDIKFPIFVYCCWQILFLIFQIFVQPLYSISESATSLNQRLFLNWVTNWDGAHYIDIATNGYQYPQQAFFPLWPLLIKTFSWIGSAYIASFILMIIFSLLSFILFYLLAKKLIGQENAKYALILFASFPSAIFLHAGYTEGLFLTLTLLSFLLLENKRYLLASIFAGFAGATRVIGIGISLSLLFIKKSLKVKLILILISWSGLIGYMLFLHINYQDPLLFIKSQNEWCATTGRCGLMFPLTPIAYFANKFLAEGIKPENIHLFWDLCCSIIFLIMLIPIFKKLGWKYLSYTAFVILIPLASGSIASMVRLVLVAFPVFLVFPLVLKSKRLILFISLLLFLLQLHFISFFINGYWVA